MAVPIRCTAFFGSDEGRGWSETHVINAPDTPGELLTYLQNFKLLMDAQRRPLLGSDCRLEGLRVSYPTASGVIASSAYKYQPFAYPASSNIGASPSVAAQARMGDVTNTMFSNVFLRGFWDAVEQNEQLDFTTAKGAQWKALFDSFAAALVSGAYGWEGINEALTQRGNITGYTVNVDNTITFTVVVTSGPPISSAPGTRLPFRAARLSASKSILNQTHTVEVVDATHLKTVKQTAAAPFETPGTFVIEHKAFVGYTGVQYVQLAKRSMGRPTGRSPARLKAKARA
jgi:hypothetical protein